MKQLLLYFILFLTVFANAQQPFDCDDPKFYQVISGALRSYDPITGNYSEPLHTYERYNGGGYNPVDNFMYALRKSDDHLIRIGLDQIVDLGAIAPNGGVAFEYDYAADVDSDGNLWVFQNNGNKQTFQKITNLQDLDGTTAPQFEIVVADQASTKAAADIVFINGHLYGGGTNSGKLYKWDLTDPTAPVFSNKAVTNLPSTIFGASYTDVDNRLYLSDNKGGLYLISDYDGAAPYATYLNNTTPTNSNDGFKCAAGGTPLDADGDGVLDSVDTDADGDGISDIEECGGVDPYGDDDGDGIFNYLDTDFGNTCNGGVSLVFDADQDGVPNMFDLDSDNDGIYDIVETGIGSYDTDNNGRFNIFDGGYADTDSDGLADINDSDQGNSIVPNDSDGDGIVDAKDIDSDQDGVVDLIEGQNPASFVGLSGSDQDKDGIDDTFDTDQGGTANGGQNTDGTDLPDYLDTDSDNDGISDFIEAYDTNSDGVADTNLANLDSDNDGMDDGFDMKDSEFDPSNGNQTPSSFPVVGFGQTTNYLGTFDSNGLPNYLASNRSVGVDFMTRIDNVLPEGSSVPDTNPDFIYSGYDTDIETVNSTTLSVTFIGENTSYKNALGYYTYDVNSPLTEAPDASQITVLFPNASATNSGGSLSDGNTVELGTFPANTGIGWVLLADAFDTGSLSEGSWQLYSETSFNPECDETLKPHSVLIADPTNEAVILGFEDQRRDNNADNDFNDVKFVITSSSFADMKTSNVPELNEDGEVTSGNDGGLESNGDLATLIAKRNYLRTRNSNVLNKKSLQQRFVKGSSFAKTETSGNLSDYFPETGANGDESAFISSPADLIGITNASQVFSVDYYNSESRVGAALAIATEGSVYDHSKVICDRLNGSVLEDIRTLTIDGYTMVSSRVLRGTGETEYVLHFSILENEFTNELYSLWNIEQYPEGNYKNFQIWGGSVKQTVNIAYNIIDKLIAEKPLTRTFLPLNIPSVFVQSGFYKEGKLVLDIVNKNETNQLVFNGNKKETEQSEEVSITQTISLSGDYKEQITIDTGYIFDIGFSIDAGNGEQDALYLADGPWGVDYLAETGAQIDTFEVSVSGSVETASDAYIIERDIRSTGQVRESVNIFRNILGGDRIFDVTPYNAVQFELYANKDVELVLNHDQLSDWNNRFVYVIKANATKRTYHIPFSEFKNRNGERADTITGLRGLVFTIQGDYQEFSPFELETGKLALTSIELSSDISNGDILGNYPNPFTSTTTIDVPNIHQKLEIIVFDMLGRVVQNNELSVSESSPFKTVYTARGLKQGVYKYLLVGDDDKEYKGSFLIRN